MEACHSAAAAAQALLSLRQQRRQQQQEAQQTSLQQSRQARGGLVVDLGNTPCRRHPHLQEQKRVPTACSNTGYIGRMLLVVLQGAAV